VDKLGRCLKGTAPYFTLVNTSVKCRKSSTRELLVCELHYVTETSLLVLAFHQCTEKYISPACVVTVVWYTNIIAWFLDSSNI